MDSHEEKLTLKSDETLLSGSFPHSSLGNVRLVLSRTVIKMSSHALYYCMQLYGKS